MLCTFQARIHFTHLMRVVQSKQLYDELGAFARWRDVRLSSLLRLPQTSNFGHSGAQ